MTEDTHDTPLRLTKLEDLDDMERATNLLELEISKNITTRINLIHKSIFDFDLTDDEGVRRLLTLLPIMDPELITLLASDIWPGHISETMDPVKIKLEMRGYLLDMLESNDENNQ